MLGLVIVCLLYVFSGLVVCDNWLYWMDGIENECCLMVGIYVCVGCVKMFGCMMLLFD